MARKQATTHRKTTKGGRYTPIPRGGGRPIGLPKPATAAQRQALFKAGLGADPAADPVAAKEKRLRQWAARIVSDLPSDDAEAQLVLKLANVLLYNWIQRPTNMMLG